MKKITLSQTYQIVTEESAEYGEYADSGFDFEDVEYTFRELVEKIESDGFLYKSDSGKTPRWLSTEAEQDMYDGSYETKSLHPGNDPRSLRYWNLAMKYLDNKGFFC